MPFCEDLREEEEVASAWHRLHPPKGARFTLRGIEFRVVQERPLLMVGPAGKKRPVDAATLSRMEPVA